MKRFLFCIGVLFLAACSKENAQQPIPPVTAFTSSLSFATSTQAYKSGVNVTVAKPDPVMRFEFDSISNLSGTPATINISVSGNLVMVVDYYSEYTSRPYKFTSANGKAFSGTFKNGDQAF